MATKKKVIKKKILKQVQDDAPHQTVQDNKVRVLKGTKEEMVKTLFKAGAHFGHVARRWNPKMEKFLHSKKGGVHIFDLEKTVDCIEEACGALTKWISEGKTIALVGTKRQAKEIIRSEADRLKLPFVVERWLGGSITNWQQMKTRIDRLIKLKVDRDAGAFKGFTKKERLMFDREIAKLERQFGGLSSLKAAPNVIVVVDIKKERTAVKEANMKGVKVVALIDSNADPELVDYPIPVNDDATSTVELVVRKLTEAIELGLKKNPAKSKSI
ncbi:30S ribosomal protein S2 [Patescibacteria group bacterium]|nr:30S ribosomal protein S2 [Patescibacteria group bacterium]